MLVATVLKVVEVVFVVVAANVSRDMRSYGRSETEANNTRSRYTAELLYDGMSRFP